MIHDLHACAVVTVHNHKYTSSKNSFVVLLTLFAIPYTLYKYIYKDMLQVTEEQIQSATNSFDDKVVVVIGRGGYGIVHKGYFHATFVAIKVLNKVYTYKFNACMSACLSISTHVYWCKKLY